MSMSQEKTKSDTEAVNALLKQASTLSRQDQILVAKAISGMAGMVAQFPPQLVDLAKGKPEKVVKTPASRSNVRNQTGKKVKPPPNPEKDTGEYKAFAETQKEILALKKGKKDIPATLTERHKANKEAYFRLKVSKSA